MASTALISLIRTCACTTLAGLCLLLATIHSGVSSERGVSAHFHGQPLAIASGILEDFIQPAELVLDDALLSDRSIWVHLHQASSAGMLQALAHGSNAWWWHNSRQQHYHLQPSATPIDRHGVRVRSYASSITGRYDLEEVVNTVMQPWLEHPDHGIAHVPWTGQWTVSTTNMGHAQLRTLLSLMEGSDTIVPMALPPQDKPLHLGRFTTWTNPQPSWPQALMDLAQSWNISLALSPSAVHLLQQLPPPSSVRDLDDLRQQLQQRYLNCSWVTGVLCIDTAPVQRRHSPILRRHFAMIPISQMSDRYDGHLIASALRRSTSGIDWSIHGRACIFIDNPPRLLVAIEGEKINRVLDHLDHLELNGSLVLGSK